MMSIETTLTYCQSRNSVVQWLRLSLITRPARIQFPGWKAIIIRCTNMAIYIRDCESLFLYATLKSVGPFYMVSMPWEVKYPTQVVNV